MYRDKEVKIGGYYGNYEVLERLYLDSRDVYYLCECHCGREQNVRGFDLLSGHSTQCKRCCQNGYRKESRERAKLVNPKCCLDCGKSLSSKFVTRCSPCARKKKSADANAFVDKKNPMNIIRAKEREIVFSDLRWDRGREDLSKYKEILDEEDE
jgi:hypothetical protein